VCGGACVCVCGRVCVTAMSELLRVIVAAVAMSVPLVVWDAMHGCAWWSKYPK